MSDSAATGSLTIVLAALRQVLGADAPVTADTELFEVPGFDSLALASLVAVLEERLGRFLDDELIVPEVFATPSTIAHGLLDTASGEGD